MSIQSLRTGYTGLRASQIGLDTASNNVANANTEGYTRRRVDQGQLLSGDSIVGRVGQGTSVDDISRARDAFLDARVRAALSQSAAFDTNAELLTRAESLLAEPDFGITSAMDDLWAGFEDLALDPTDTGRRTSVMNQLDVLTSRINAVSKGMDDLVNDTSARAATDLDSINLSIVEVAQLNAAIVRGGTKASTPNDLYDQRDLVLDSLVEEVGAKVTYQDDGTVRVSLNGMALVDGITPNALSWYITNQTLTHTTGYDLQAGGRFGGLQAFIAQDAPDIINRLDQLTIDVADALNSYHQGGFVDSGVGGGALVSYSALDPAGTISVVLTDIADFALSGIDGTPFPIHNGDNALRLASLRDDQVAAGGADSLLGAARELVSNVGGRTASAKAWARAQGDLAATAELSRTSAHGINIDEELIDLIRYQRAYEAAARVITAADQALDTLINRTGLVGR